MENYIFDFDGTLADSEQCSILATQEAFEKQGYSVPSAKQIKYYMGIPIEKSFIEMHTDTLSKEDFSRLLTTFREIYEAIEQETLAVFPKVNEMLTSLNKQKKRCFVLSSKKTAVLKRNLEILKIDSFFEDALGSDRVNHYKPHPDGIFTIQQQHALSLQNTLMIGDAVFDLQMGKAAGVHTCAVTWGSHTKQNLLKEEPDWCIDEPLQLLSLI